MMLDPENEGHSKIRQIANNLVSIELLSMKLSNVTSTFEFIVVP
jgi:hypothetical protein